MAGNIK